MTEVDSLDAVITDAVRLLCQGASDRKHGMHLPVVATSDGALRIMVLRAVDPEGPCIRFHTDRRAPKVARIGADPSVSVLAYDKDAGVQLRMRGRGRIETDSAEAKAAWEASTNFARRCYLAPYPPSTAIDGPSPNLPDDVREEEPDEERLEAEARENFAILKVELDEIDWFSLAHDGHRRALWRRGGGSTWLAP